MRRLAAVLMFVVLLARSAVALAHPLGNFTTNLHLGVLLGADRLAATLVVDMAEIPAFREREIVDDSADEIVSVTEATDYATASCRAHQPDVRLLIDGRPLVLDLTNSKVSFPPGQAGLALLRLECIYGGSFRAASGELTIDNRVYADRLGWAEIVVAGDGVAVQTTLPQESPSAVLTGYPNGRTSEERQGSVFFRPGAVTAETQSTTMARPTLVERIGSGVVGSSGGLALLAALALGAGHAIAPGHGKTLMAAYLVGRRGTPRTAIGLGLSVALSHTFGVAVLGAITAATTSAFQPETVYPWLSLVSAAIVLAIGGAMVYRAVRRQRVVGHHHHNHGHEQDHDHRHEHGHDHPGASAGGWRSMAALGLAGGLVPSASAVVLLLGAIAHGEAWWGLLLVAGFGVGMSASLIGAGLLAVGAQRWGWERLSTETIRQTWERRFPVLGGMGVTLIGLWLIWDSTRRFFT